MARELTTFYIVRHGRTEWNNAHRMQGHMDSPLTSEGLAQAKELAGYFSPIHFDAVFSSDVMRAKRTAEIIVSDREIAIETTKLLREASFGKYEGITWEKFEAELREKLEEREKLELESFMKYSLSPEVETYESTVMRLILFLREASLAYQGKTLLVVSHSGIMQALLMHLGFATHKQLPPGSVKNLAHIKLESDGTDFFIKETVGIEKR